jgi:acyl-coenzyme A thioesterase PaaI-like protein
MTDDAANRLRTGLFVAQNPPSPAAALLATILRRIGALLAGCDVPDEVAASAAVMLAGVERELARFGRDTRFPPTPDRGDELFLGHPTWGPYNPMAPPVALIEASEAGTRCRAQYGVASEGPPGCAHGGALAAALDAVLGATAGLAGQPGMTRSLALRYRRPTPLHRDVDYEATVDAVDDRDVSVSGRAAVDGVTTVEATAAFTRPR